MSERYKAYPDHSFDDGFSYSIIGDGGEARVRAVTKDDAQAICDFLNARDREQRLLEAAKGDT